MEKAARVVRPCALGLGCVRLTGDPRAHLQGCQCILAAGRIPHPRHEANNSQQTVEIMGINDRAITFSHYAHAESALTIQKSHPAECGANAVDF